MEEVYRPISEYDGEAKSSGFLVNKFREGMNQISEDYSNFPPIAWREFPNLGQKWPPTPRRKMRPKSKLRLQGPTYQPGIRGQRTEIGQNQKADRVALHDTRKAFLSVA